jgi:hypothetical protein
LKTINVIEDQNIFDIALQEYGDTRGVVFILADNPDTIPNLDTELTAGMEIIIGDRKVEKEEIKGTVKEESSLFYEVVTEGQNIYDLAVQCYGGLEGVFMLMEDNPDLLRGLNDSIPVGSQIKIDQEKAVNKDVLKYFKKSGIRVNNTNDSGEGVGYWRVEQDNIVS